jgi:hypothetical protein
MGLEFFKGVAIQYLFKNDASDVQRNDREKNLDQSNLKKNCKSPQVIEAKSSTIEFWLKCRTNMPKLFDLDYKLFY